jgi:hypothetical protein
MPVKSIAMQPSARMWIAAIELFDLTCIGMEYAAAICVPGYFNKSSL